MCEMTGRPRLRSTRIAAGVTALACVLSSCSPGPLPYHTGANASKPMLVHPQAPPCPSAPSLSAPPQRIVTMDGGAAAILTELDVGDRIVGTASPDFFDAFAQPQRSQLARIPVIDSQRGSAEAVINAKPDLVVGVSLYSFGGFDGTPTVQQLHEAGAEVIVACQDPAIPGPVPDLSVTTTFIDQTAKLLNVTQRGNELNARIRGELDRVRPAPGATPMRVLVLSAAPVGGQPVLTQGARSLANGVIALAGGRNIAGDIDMDFASLSPEVVVARDPQAIVVVTGFAPVSDQELTASIRQSPVLAATTAVREGRLVAVPQSIAISPSVLNGEAVARIARVLRQPPT